MAKITRVEQALPVIQKKKKVAAYARVSKESERMMHSLSAQVSYYSSLIQKNPEWEYAGVYADNFVSGTSTAKRDEFNRMETAVTDYDESLVRKLIEKITVYNDHFTVEFKSGLETNVAM